MSQSTIPVKQLAITTSVGTPGSDALIPTEKAVRTAIGAGGGGGSGTLLATQYNPAATHGILLCAHYDVGA